MNSYGKVRITFGLAFVGYWVVLAATNSVAEWLEDMFGMPGAVAYMVLLAALFLFAYTRIVRAWLRR